VLDRPLDRPLEYRPVVGVHAEDEAAVDHDAQIVQTFDSRCVVAAHVLVFPLFGQVRRVERFESDKETSQPRFHGALEQVGREHGVHGPGGLPETSHPAHALEKRRGEAAIAEQVIVQKIEMAAGEPFDLGKRGCRRSGYRTIGRLRRTLPCSRNRIRAGSRATRRSNSATR
jgi:hypothetical protein